MHLFFYGLMLGLGAAVPIGPINLEMMRRNLKYGTASGIFLGLGACSADVTYVILLCAGALVLLTHPFILNTIGVLGALLLFWFGYQAFFLSAKLEKNLAPKKSLPQSIMEGFLLTFVNPYTILFWMSVSAQLLLVTHGKNLAVLIAAVGVIIGTLSWVIFYNVILKFTRHKLSQNVIQLLNRLGGIVLWGFAFYGLYHVVSVNF
ncbi:MAG: hypothetical protein CMF49_07760 [Legionellales bacterium]|nr:hypothetical protein [Legionellales bacterium]